MIAIPAGFNPQDYLALERQQTMRHEYRYGLVYAMAGGSDDHNEITLNLIECLRPTARDRNCQLFASDVKVSHADRFFYYPDVFITCAVQDRDDRYIKRHPKLIAEVLSPSTEKFDRAQKFEDYQQLVSLEEYLLISTDEIRVELRQRQSDGTWKTTIYRSGDRVFLASIQLEVDLSQIYRGVSWNR
ncbi:Uma2 family endonuclease [Oscillatoria sp. FACHB-1406]|nr:Uma2 family endonuclease [Oscillatoria sp. FACHB-1406]